MADGPKRNDPMRDGDPCPDGGADPPGGVAPVWSRRTEEKSPPVTEEPGGGMNFGIGMGGKDIASLADRSGAALAFGMALAAAKSFPAFALSRESRESRSRR